MSAQRGDPGKIGISQQWMKILTKTNSPEFLSVTPSQKSKIKFYIIHPFQIQTYWLLIISLPGEAIVSLFIQFTSEELGLPFCVPGKCRLLVPSFGYHWDKI